MTRRPARRPTSARSSREWAVRGGLAVAALALGYVSTTQTLAYALVKSDPERAFALSPNDGRVAGTLAQKLAVSEQAIRQRTDRQRADRLAGRALAAEPLSVKALTALAIGVDIAGDTPAARRLFVHSDALSRRELGTRIWLIEDAVSRGDVPGALRHYDIALRTEPSAPELLYPILTEAIAEPEIATGLLDLLRTRPPWREGFLGHVGAAGTAPADSARFFERAARRGIPVPEMARISVVNALVGSGAYDLAWNYYRWLRPGVDRRISRDPSFEIRSDIRAPFDWVPILNEAGVSVDIGGGGVQFAAPPVVGGPILQQVQFLPPGRYRLEGEVSDMEQSDDALPYWQLVCTSGRELGRVDVPNVSGRAIGFGGDLTVGGDCPAQILRLVLRPTSNVGGTAGRLDRLALRPAGDRP
ncbi:hypothetical protein ACNI3Q_05335 [Sphingomonas sp. FW199]|uniref:hypothetical protein n=1 Tax=Sphingomonas sp. FW199 TaxID=3400217 RepID=UPI003CEC8A48